MVEKRKHIGYFISKKRCLKAFSAQKKSKKTGRMVTKRVNSKNKALRKGTRVYKTKAKCLKALAKKSKKTAKKPKKTAKKTKGKKTKFGLCAHEVPYFGTMVPSIAKTSSGTKATGYSSAAWKWPVPPSALHLDRQEGSYNRY